MHVCTKQTCQNCYSINFFFILLLYGIQTNQGFQICFSTAKMPRVLGSSLSLQARLNSDLRDTNVRYGALQRSPILRDARRAKGFQTYKDNR